MITPDQLLAGPRGRRLLLQFAIYSDFSVNPEYTPTSLWAAIMDAAYQMSPGKGTSVVRIGVGGEVAEVPDVSPQEVARRLADVPLADVTPHLLRSVLQTAVDNARYWQPPDGEDNLAATDSVRAALRRVAAHIAQSSHSAWWNRDIVPHDQWSVQWHTVSGFEQASISDAEYRVWREQLIEGEAVARQHNHLSRSGAWWSIPIVTLPRTTASMDDAGPAGLWFVEDRRDEDRAIVRPYLVPPHARVYEIRSAEDWAELCRRYPLEVTGQRQPDWYRTTGRRGRWLLPDWSAVRHDFDGVHLTVAAYLAAAGTAILVDDDTASVIAGWDPDSTWWLRDSSEFGESRTWVRRDLPGPGHVWMPEDVVTTVP